MRGVLRSLVAGLLASLTRGVVAKHQPTVIAVTGSVGKTLTRDAIFTVLNGSFSVWQAHESLNSEFGVPLAVFGIHDRPASWSDWLAAFRRGLQVRFRRQVYPELLVLEYGASKPGDIAFLTDMVRPFVGVVTAVAPAHTEFFGTIEAVAAEKAQLIKALPADGFALLCADDSRVSAMAARTKAAVATFGFSESADVRAASVKLKRIATSLDAAGQAAPVELTATIQIDKEKIQLVLPGFIAPYQLNSALAAVAVGRAFGIDLVTMVKRLRNLRPAKGRMNLLEGKNDSWIIDDSYDASPLAVHAALKVLGEFPGVSRRIAVLGEMGELGERAVAEHEAAGRAVAGVADILVATGSFAEAYAAGARSARMNADAIVVLPDSRAAGQWLQQHVSKKDLLLIKGSQNASRMERAVAAVLREPARASELLERQDAFWTKRSG